MNGWFNKIFYDLIEIMELRLFGYVKIIPLRSPTKLVSSNVFAVVLKLKKPKNIP